MYTNIVKIERCITANQVQSALGLTGEDSAANLPCNC